MNNKYVNIIISKLLNKYENSKVSKSGSIRNLSISLVFNEKNMIDYVGEFGYKYEDDIEKAVKYLESNNYISVSYNSDKKIHKVILNLDNVDKCYTLINKDSLSERRDKINEVLNKYNNKGKLVNFCRDKIKRRNNEFLSNKKYYDDDKDLEELLYILDKLDNQKEEISRRVFSVKYLKDSKRLETILSRLESIIKECDNVDYEDALANYNVYKNPSFVYLKGIGKFKVNNQIIDLEKLDLELILSSNHVKKIEIISLDCEEIVTVENLTSFYEYPKNNRCVIYLGGFHNEIKRIILKKLYNFNTNLLFFHTGDIDAGGFYILKHLIADTQINFKTRFMDINTLENYKKKCLSLTNRDKERLLALKNDDAMEDYVDVIDYMLDKNIKLEQENVKY